jgi:hypothetical protein
VGTVDGEERVGDMTLKCFELVGGRLPFGFHAWARYDRKFLEPCLFTNADDAIGQVSSEYQAQRTLRTGAETRDACR